MAIRGPAGPPHGPAGPHGPSTSSPSPDAVGGRSQAPSPLQRLVDFGMARTPAEARAVLHEILTLLASAGFPVPKTGTAEQQLSSSLRLLQKEAGLPPSGVLDAATLRALKDRGLAPGSREGDATVGSPSGRSPSTTTPATSSSETHFTFGGPSLLAGALPRLRAGDDSGGAGNSGAARARTVETDAARARVDAGRPDVTLDLKGMLDALRAAGFVGGGRGREQLTDAVKKLQRVDGLPPTGRLDAATTDALQRRGVLDSATALALKEQDPAWHPPAPGSPASSSSTDVRAPVVGATADPSTQGTLAERSNDLAGRDGAPPTSVAGGGRGDVGGAGTTVGDVGDDGVVDDGDDKGRGSGVGHDVAGDDDDEGQQGNANVDAAAAEPGAHWRAPTLSDQIIRALRGIQRDDDGRGAATYRFELLLVRPGVYAAGQPARELLRLVVERAGPFDDAWRQALDALNDRLRRYEPEARAFVDADVRAALQRARYRAVDDAD